MEIFDSYDIIQFKEGPVKKGRAWVSRDEIKGAELELKRENVADYFSASDLKMLKNPEAHPLYNPEH